MPTLLKSFELHGYKTFATRSEFVFAEGITAIVGPNGSGKSNIADALRWVLGEQSFGLLRAKKTEDMIFAGSEHRPRAGMASATIIFDNAGGWLPIDFTEVGITRRAYRDGENEYLINGQKTRLKDVTELLAKSGLAEMTYTVIGQGLVDAALALKAEERRRLFEEAAGIGLHRARREEALRRLESTRRNLERVEDILAELQPRLRSLERQAKRALEYEQVKADLRLVLREWYGYHWHHSQSELRDAQEVVKQQEGLYDQSHQAQFDLEQQLSVMRNHIHELREKLAGWHRLLADHHGRREQTSRDIAVAEERQRLLSRQGEDISIEVERIQSELVYQQEGHSIIEAESSQLQGELEEANRLAAEARQKQEEQQAERRRIETEIQAVRDSLTAIMTQQAHLHTRENVRQIQQRKQADALDSLKMEISSIENTLNDGEKSYAVALNSSKEARERYRQAEEVLDTHRRAFSVKEKEYKQAKDELAGLEARVVRLQTQLNVIEQAEKDLTGYAEGARVLLHAMADGQPMPTRGALVKSLEIPAEYEIAISAALGEYLDAVILETSTNVEEALEILRSKTTRGALIPLESLTPGRSLRIDSTKAPGGKSFVIGLGNDLVSTAHEIKPVVDLLLGQVVVVRDRRAAKMVLESSDWVKLPNLRVVTLDGELYYANGLIVSGTAGSGIISRAREMRDINLGLSNALTKKGELDNGLHQQSSALDKLAEEEARLVNQLELVRTEITEADKVLNQEEKTVERTRREYQWLMAKRSAIEAELQSGHVEEVESRAMIEQLDGQILKAREQLSKLTSALEMHPIEEINATVSHWNTRLAVIQRAITGTQQRFDERKEVIQNNERNIRLLQERQVGIARELELLVDGQQRLRHDDSVITKEIGAIQSLIDPAEVELNAEEQSQSGLLARDIEARKSLRNAEHLLAQARIALARKQEGLISLRGKIEDDFGLVAFDYAESVSGPKPLPLQGMVEELPKISALSPEAEDFIIQQRTQLRRMGAINPEAQLEYQEVKERFEFLTEQVSDLKQAEADIQEVIAELDVLMEREFRRTFDDVAQEFRQIFTRLFGGGTARLVLTNPEDLTDTGIDIEARLPGRREQGLALLSGGERSLTATALVFALLRVSPTPFCVLDEVDAMLDEANVGRFRELLSELSERTQFIVITHNRNTVQAADVIYGVTMGRDSASQVISLKMDDLDEQYGV